jgi:hypothetical protein
MNKGQNFLFLSFKCSEVVLKPAIMQGNKIHSTEKDFSQIYLYISYYDNQTSPTEISFAP